jgi:SAM-dependent methyltransferase
VHETRFSYERLAWCYDELARLYSFGLIGAAKRVHLDHLAAGDRVLYAGSGRVEEAVLAARRGLKVTALDLSPAMLRKLGEGLRREGLDADLRCESLFDHSPGTPYDAVAAHYVLDLWRPRAMERALGHLAGMVAPDGLLSIADFAPLEAGRRGFVAALHFWPVALAARVLGLAELHAPHDYVRALADRDFGEVECVRHRAAGRGPALHMTWLARRANHSAEL